MDQFPLDERPLVSKYGDTGFDIAGERRRFPAGKGDSGGIDLSHWGGHTGEINTILTTAPQAGRSSAKAGRSRLPVWRHTDTDRKLLFVRPPVLSAARVKQRFGRSREPGRTAHRLNWRQNPRMFCVVNQMAPGAL